MDTVQVLGALRMAREEATALREAAEAEAEEIRQSAREDVKREKEEAKKASKDADRARKEAEKIRQDTYQASSRLAEIQAQVVTTDETAMLQQVGIYAYRHQLQDAIAYRTRLDSLQAEIKNLARTDQAVLAVQHWTVNGSASAGRKMVRDFSKLMLKAYNAEADYAVRSMRPHRLSSLIDRLYKSRETIAKLGATMQIRISDAYHDTRVRELQLTELPAEEEGGGEGSSAGGPSAREGRGRCAAGVGSRAGEAPEGAESLPGRFGAAPGTWGRRRRSGDGSQTHRDREGP
ncbi:DUF4041 domain-containing protein [Streptomyces mirabilis]|uniref:DUF4041 domain-containing protein n=1 Tax=Streptomyces mirabilis TaxID=68239 RepID=UPI0036ADB16E